MEISEKCLRLRFNPSFSLVSVSWSFLRKRKFVWSSTLLMSYKPSTFRMHFSENVIKKIFKILTNSKLKEAEYHCTGLRKEARFKHNRLTPKLPVNSSAKKAKNGRRDAPLSLSDRLPSLHRSAMAAWQRRQRWSTLHFSAVIARRIGPPHLVIRRTWTVARARISLGVSCSRQWLRPHKLSAPCPSLNP